MTETSLRQRPGDQPLPRGGRACVQDALIAEIERRKQLGISRYGQPLLTHNGRSSIRDAREEVVDLALYLLQHELEEADAIAALARVKAWQAEPHPGLTADELNALTEALRWHHPDETAGLESKTGPREASCDSQAVTAAHPAIEAWSRASDRASRAEATSRRVQRLVRSWSCRDLHREAAQLLNELDAALGEPETTEETEPRDTAADALRSCIRRAAVMRAIGPGRHVQEVVDEIGQVLGWNKAMTHIRELLDEMGTPAAPAVHPPATQQVSIPPLSAWRGPANRDRAHLLGLLCAYLPEEASVLLQPQDIGDCYGLLITILGEQLSFAVREEDVPWLADVRWALPDNPTAQHDGHTPAEQEQRINSLITQLVALHQQPSTPEPPEQLGLRAVVYGTGIVTIPHPTTGHPHA